MLTEADRTSSADWPAERGEMALRIRAFDWTATSLGSIVTWPERLRAAVDFVLDAHQPAYVAWGPDLTTIYNDGYIPVLAGRHPNALGLPYARIWADLWEEYRPVVARVMAGEAQYFVDRPVDNVGPTANPRAWFTFSWTPLRDAAGTVAGFSCTVTETTDAVLAQEARRAEERRRVAAAVCASEERLRLALDVAELGTWSWDLVTGAGEIDERGAEIVGLAPGDLDDIVAAQVARTHPEDLAGMQDAAAAGIVSRSPFTLNYRAVHEDGSVHHVTSRARVVTDKAGTPIRLVGTNRDVTAEREADAALRASEERFRALQSAGSDMIYRMSPDWSEMRQLDGRRVLADTGSPDPDWLNKYIHPDDQARYLAAVKEAIDKRDTFRLEHRVIRADGSMGWMFSRAVPIFDGGDQVVEWFGAARDISERKRAEEALREARDESERRRRLYEAITASTPDLIYVFDRDYRFRYANEALLAMWGLTWEQSAGKRLLEVGYEPWHAEMHEREIDQVIETKQPIRGEVTFPHAALGRRVYDYIFVPVLDANGEVEVVAGTTRDITEIRALSRQKDEFIGIVSHELKTPVTSIKAYAQILQRRFRASDNPESVEMMGKMLLQIDKLNGLIGDLLDVTKIEAGQLQFHEEFFDIDALIDELVEVLQPTTDRHRIIRNGRTNTRVMGDRERTGQVVTNLLTNAIKYSPEADTIIIHAAADDEQVTIGVQDFGSGLAEEDRERVFERFYRVGGPKQDTFPGLGLGLYISAEIVRRQGGRIWVTSEEGRGATFSFCLPLGGIVPSSLTRPAIPAQKGGQ